MIVLLIKGLADVRVTVSSERDMLRMTSCVFYAWSHPCHQRYCFFGLHSFPRKATGRFWRTALSSCRVG
jgi:hypothetical protein